MPRVPAVDPIEYLVKRKFPLPAERSSPMAKRYGGTENPLALATPRDQWAQILAGVSPERAQAEERYRIELRRKSPIEIEVICAAEREVEMKEAVARVEAEEQRRFYCLPMQPDYDHYFKCATWTLEEAVALSFGKDPERVNSKAVEQFAQTGPQAKMYMKRWTQTQRAKATGQLWDPVYPNIFLAWAKNLGLDLPPELMTQVTQRSLSLKNWQNLYEEQVAHTKKQQEQFTDIIAKWKEALDGARSENAQLKEQIVSAPPHPPSAPSHLPAAPTDEPSTATRNAMLKLIIGMAAAGYGFDPRQDRNSATADIRGDLERLDIGLSDETILKYLRQGSKLLPEGAMDSAIPKPKSVKRLPKSG